ncbi:MAG TPA: NADH-quinone oxidoreductase subunit C [Candidatus Aquicultor sp.]|jgi:NADH/F420H2 dehydrogenase subunit C
MIEILSGENMPEKARIVEEKGLGHTLTIQPAELLKVATGLHEAGFDLFMFVTGVDYPDSIKVAYRLYSTAKNISLIVKTEVPKSNPVVDSVTALWPNANWHERETYDLFGVQFKGHPDLRRIFMPEDWVGHPLRKDYSDDRMIVFPNAAVKKEKAVTKPGDKASDETAAAEKTGQNDKKELTPEEKEAKKAAARAMAAAKRAEREAAAKDTETKD